MVDAFKWLMARDFFLHISVGIAFANLGLNWTDQNFSRTWGFGNLFGNIGAL
tara:strand:- start:137 stop:292 length:156 start_codon:yes stop_codon:yes gene_type:complete